MNNERADYRVTWWTPSNTRTSGYFPDMTPDEIRKVITEHGEGTNISMERVTSS